MKITACLVSKDPNISPERFGWFVQCLRSLQHFDEVLVCVEGLTPIELEAIPSICQNKNLRVLERKTPLSSWDAGAWTVKEARNPWVTMACDDDYFCPDNVRIFIENVNHDRPGVFYFPYYVINPETGKFGIHTPPPPFSRHDLAQYNFISTAAIFHKDVYYGSGPRNENCRAEDWDLWARAYACGFQFHYFWLPLYYQRFYSTSRYASSPGIDKVPEMIRAVLFNKKGQP